MTVRTSERGDGRIGVIIAIALIGGLFFAGVKYVPVRVNAYEFNDFVKDQARFASNTTNEEIRKRILEKAAELRIPLEKKNLKISRSQTEVLITAKFEQVIDFKVKTYNYKFDIDERAPLF